MPHPRRIAIALCVDQPYPHHQEVLTGVRQYAREYPGWKCIIDEHPSYVSRSSKRELPAYDGVIARASPELQRRLKQLKIPLVNVWYQQARPWVAGVYPDPQVIGRLAAEHFFERGFRKLGFIGITSSRQSAAIGQAFAACALERGAVCRIDGYQSGNFIERGYWLAVRSYLENLLDTFEIPVGIFVIESGVARLLTTICEERGWRVAQEMAVVCWENVRTIVELPPQITCIDNNYVRIGYEAAKLLHQLISGAPVPETGILLPPKGMIARESTDFFAVEDALVAAALRYISSHLSQELSVESIAEAAATSPRTLQRRFKTVLGHPISDEIRRLRLALAKRLLGEEDLQVRHIARVSGFKSSVTLNHVFQRELGMSPSEYRNQIQGEQLAD